MDMQVVREKALETLFKACEHVQDIMNKNNEKMSQEKNIPETLNAISMLVEKLKV